MEKINKYMLFVFAGHEKQEEFVECIAEELIYISCNINIRYYYGPESAIFTFSSNDSFRNVKDFMSIILGDNNIIYFLLPYETDKMSSSIDGEAFKHLFSSVKPDNKSDFENEAQKMLYKELEDKLNSCFSENNINEITECEEITSLKLKSHKLSVDEILDKINETGIKSLTSEELETLNNCSK
jgi:hypothetical protein